MPQVASSPVIQPVRPEVAGRPAAAADESAGTFGGMLDASAGSGAPSSDPGRNAGALAANDAACADNGSTQAKATGTAPVSANDAQIPPTTAETPGSVVTPVDLAMLAQAISTDVATAPSGGEPSGTSKNAGNGAARPDKAGTDKADASSDAAPSVAIPDVTNATIPAMPVAVVATPPAVPSDAPPVPDAKGVNGPATASSAAPLVSGAPDTSKATGSDPSSPIAAAATDATAQAAVETDPPVDTSAPLAALDPAGEKTQSDKPAATSQPPAKAGAVAAVGLANVDTKIPLPAAPQTGKPKVEGNKASAAKSEKAGKADDAPHAETKPAQPQWSAEEAHASAAGQPDSRAPALHQPHGQPSDHASATARVAFAAAHSDASASGAVAQSVTAQLGRNPSGLGINLAAPAASPLPSLWQATPQRADLSDNAVPIAGVAVEIASRVQDGLRRFEIRLDPPELGRIDVRLDVDRGGTVTSRLTVERAETLDLLRRDAPQLERALQHAGLNTEGGLQFSLRDQNFANRDQGPRNAPAFIVPDDEAAATEAARRGYGRLLGLGGGIDIRV